MTTLLHPRGDEFRCTQCGYMSNICQCELIGDEPDADCFFCAGTGLAPNGWDNCPECMASLDDEDDDWRTYP